MSLVLFDLPEEPAKWPDWLDCQLAGPRLIDLVLQLRQVLGEPTTPVQSLDGICGPQLPLVFNAGLKALDESQIRQLLKHPEVLVDLQERILGEGGDYWTSLPVPEDVRQVLDRQWAAISAQIQESGDIPEPDVSVSMRSPRPIKRWQQIATAAAVLLIGIAVIWSIPHRVDGWGFDRPALVSSTLAPAPYLNSLADAAEDWFSADRVDEQNLSQRLQQFLHGCDTLIAAPHSQLAQFDRDWLIERCQTWKSALASELADLKSGAKPAGTVHEESDAIIRKLVNALRQRAETVA